MPSIAIVVNSFPKLSESFIINKVKLLSENGFDVSVITHTRNNISPIEEALNSININLITSPSALSKLKKIKCIVRAFSFDIKQTLKIYKHIKKENKSFHFFLKQLLLYIPFRKKYEIVHFAFSGLGVTYLKIIPLLNKEMLVYTSCRGHAEQIRPLFNQKRKEELSTLFRIVNRIHCVSNDIQNTCEKFGLEPSKSFVNRPAVDSTHFKPKENKSTTYSTSTINITTTGRLHWKKSQESIFIAIKLLKDKGINVSLKLAGDGPELEKLIYIVNLLQIEEEVHFLGKQTTEQIRELLEQTDIYVHSSISEGISNAVMEAMAMELPVICTNIGGMNELIDDGIDGILVQAFQPQEIANKLLWLIEMPEIRITIGKKARLKIINEFSLDRQLRVYLNEYKDSLYLK